MSAIGHAYHALLHEIEHLLVQRRCRDWPRGPAALVQRPPLADRCVERHGAFDRRFRRLRAAHDFDYEMIVRRIEGCPITQRSGCCSSPASHPSGCWTSSTRVSHRPVRSRPSRRRVFALKSGRFRRVLLDEIRLGKRNAQLGVNVSRSREAPSARPYCGATPTLRRHTCEGRFRIRPGSVRHVEPT